MLTHRGGKDIAFAVGIVLILCLFFLPVPAVMIDFGIALSIALSVLILMVALWIHKPLEFSPFPTVLLVATILRLALNISTTRLILSRGEQGPTSAGYIIGGFARLVMGGDFVIGIIVFLILVTINFLVITKGATRIAEVGARFTLDAIPGKQMAIDADLSAGLIDEKVAQARRRELEEESAFFGSMDGASKFVRGDAIAGIIILAVNIFGGIVIGVTRHGLTLSAAADVFTKLSVGDGLVSQIPALIISLAAGLLVAKGGTRGSADKAVLDQLAGYPNALLRRRPPHGGARRRAGPAVPALRHAGRPYGLRRRRHSPPHRQGPRRGGGAAGGERRTGPKPRRAPRSRSSSSRSRSSLCFSKELNAALLTSRDEIGSRIAKMRRKFARQYGFVVPEIHVSDDIKAPPKTYQIKIHGTAVATQELRVRDYLVIIGDGPRPNLPGDEVREPAFGMRAIAIAEAFVKEAKREGFKPIDPVSVLLTHLSEVIHNNLAQLLSYKDMRALLDRLEPEYKRLLDDMCPSQISQSGLLATLKLLLAERVSIRNLSLILEAVAEIAPHVRRPEQIAEHVRIRLSQQICGDLADQRRTRGAEARQSMGPRLPSEPQARRQGRRRRVRHRPAADGAIRRRGFDGDPQAHGRAAPVRDRHRRRDAPLRANDHRAHVPDPGRAVATRNRARLRSQVARDDRVTALIAEALAAPQQALAPEGGARRLRAVLPHRRLPDDGARILERPDSDANSLVRCACGHADPDAAAARESAQRRAWRRPDPDAQGDRRRIARGRNDRLSRAYLLSRAGNAGHGGRDHAGIRQPVRISDGRR